MSEPVGYFEQEYVGGPVLFYQVNYKAEGSIPLYAHPDPRIAEFIRCIVGGKVLNTP